MNAQRNRPSSKKNRQRRFSQLRLVFGLLLLLGMAGVLHVRSTAQAQEPNDALLGQLREASGGEVVVSYHDETGVVRFIGTSNETPIRQSRALAPDATPDQAARAFLGTYGSLFGIQEQQAELSMMAEQKVEDGRSFVRYQQRHQGIPILAGELVVQVNRMGSVVSANGETLPNVTLDVNPRISAADAERTALELVAKHEGVSVETLRAKQAELWIFNPALLEGPGMRVNSLVWRTEVTPTDLLPIRYLVLVDAKTGAITLQFNQIAEAKNRRVYDAANTSALPGTLRRTEGQAATGDADIDLAYDYAGNTYDFFKNEHNRDSLDGAGMALISTVRYCDPDQPCPLENAFWNGQQMAYGQGYASADDVVGHELTHGVTNFSSNLYYYYQSGAINESFSDVWGEFVDLTNARGNDTAGVRWLMGEDLVIGAIRDMKNPPAFNHPDRIGSSIFYCGSEDSGGVHLNSGVNNKAAFLMTDGGTFNGRTVTGL
ncbi:MAG TPA: M4 family metallopeptidase, partial [Ardenticatenaceae bacterium]